MKKVKYTYYRGGEHAREAVEFEIFDRGQYVTTCVVDVDMLIRGIKAAPCGNGDDYELNSEERLAILELIKEERKKLTSVDIKTMDGWRNSGLPTFEDYAQPGDTVSQDVVDYFMNIVPPMLMKASCAQAGEAYSFERDDNGRYRNTYTTFHRIGKELWTFDGYCFKGENENREHYPSRLEKAIEEAREETEK